MFTIISFFQKLIKGGVGIRAGGWKIFQKLISGGGDDYSVLESTNSQLATRKTGATRNSQLATRNSQLATRNSQLALYQSTFWRGIKIFANYFKGLAAFSIHKIESTFYLLKNVVKI